MSKATSNLKAYLSMPERLQDLVEQSLVFMRSHPEHMLNFGYRYAIYTAIGSEYPSPPKTDIIGHKRRAYLYILTVQYVLPLWKTTWDHLAEFPRHVIQAASDILLKGITDATHRWLEHNRSPHLYRIRPNEFPMLPTNEHKWNYVLGQLWGDMEYLASVIEQESELPPTVVGFGAVKALSVTLFDEDYPYSKPDFLITEEVTDWYGWDSAYYAMMAISRWRSKGSDKFKRKAFWEWWLLDAIPHAYSRF